MNGSYDANWKANQLSEYNNGAVHGVEASSFPFSQTVFEPSPLNRPFGLGAPGADWQVNPSDGHDPAKRTVKMYYEINAATDNVRLFGIDMISGSVSSAGFYATGSLTVAKIIDEHGGVTKEFIDKAGHLLLKQVYIENDVLQTYYIYDEKNQLVMVLQPEAVKAIMGN